jgi:hypothetical protein
LWNACDALLDEQYSEKLSPKKEAKALLEASNKINFITKAKAFATKYLDSDIKRTTYLLKDVYNWKKYCDISRDFKDVPWDELVELEDNTKAEEEIACAGGACLV